MDALVLMKRGSNRLWEAVRMALGTRTAAWLGVAFVLTAIAAVSLISRFAVDPVVSREAEDFLGRIANESTAVTDHYLAAAESVVGFGVGAVPELPSDEAALIPVFAAALRKSENLNGFYVAYPNGDFTYVARVSDGSAVSWRSRVIRERVDGSRHLEERWVDDEFVDVEDPVAGPADYDPTERPWFVALGDDEVEAAWSDPYVFHSSGELGLTYSQSIRAADGSLSAVVGADLTLTELVGFLRERRPTDESLVQVVDGAGRVVASASMNADNLHNPVDTSGLITAVTPLGLNPEWSLVVGAEQSDLMSSTDEFRSNRAQLVGLLVGTALVAALMILGALSYVRALRQAAAIDTLTKLESRWGATRSIQRYLRRGAGPATLAIIDLDGFKRVNDQLGHAAGDQALRCVGDRLKESMPEDGIVGRLGGDEFVALIAGADDPDAVLSRIHALVAQPIEIFDDEVTIGASIGTTSTSRGRTTPVSKLLREADLALYHAKAAGGGLSARFDPEMDRRNSDELDRRDRLERGILNDEFCLYFQPEIDLTSTEIVGAEALLRWELSDGRVLAADEFIEDLERFGLLSQVIGTLERDALAMGRQLDDGLTLRLNISAEQITDDSIHELVSTFTRRLPDVQLCLELTERSVLDANTATRSGIDAIRSHGVLIALDDFGTGFGSLKQLHDLPIDAIKIDRSFVGDLDGDQPDIAIVSILVELGALLGVAVVAEGVETEQQYNSLCALGCATGQGWLFAPALPAPEFLDLLDRQGSGTGESATDDRQLPWRPLVSLP